MKLDLNILETHTVDDKPINIINNMIVTFNKPTYQKKKDWTEKEAQRDIELIIDDVNQNNTTHTIHTEDGGKVLVIPVKKNPYNSIKTIIADQHDYENEFGEN